MTLKTFYQLATRVKQIIESSAPVADYQELITALDQARSNPTTDTVAAVKKILEQVNEKSRNTEAEISKLPYGQYFLELLNIDYIGDHAYSKLAEIVNQEPYLANTSIQALVDKTNQLVSRLTSIINSLNEFEVDLSDEKTPVLSIEFTGESDIETTGELKYKLEQIEKITHAYGRLDPNPGAFAKPQIVSISKSSPFMIEIGPSLQNTATLYFLGKSIKWLMDVVEQQYSIRIKRQELKKLKMQNEKIEDGFKELETSLTSNEALLEHVNELVEEANPSEQSGSKEEISKALCDALRKLLVLIEKGAKPNVYLPSEVVDENVENDPIEFTLGISSSLKGLETKEKELKQLSDGNNSPE